METYKKLRNKVTNLTEIAKKKTYQSKIEEGKSYPRTIYKLLNEFGINCKGNGYEHNFGIRHDGNNTITKNQIWQNSLIINKSS